jgi:antitoxin (DNA-binding transcriptional repressor) of toxin-antitoxin stability system
VDPERRLARRDAGADGRVLGVDKVASSSYFRNMRAVGVKVLKNKLSEYVRLAERGETVLVTDRDRVVAELGPPRPGRAPLLSDALLAEAVREGWLTAPLMVAEGPPSRRPVATWEELARELDADRGDR